MGILYKHLMPSSSDQTNMQKVLSQSFACDGQLKQWKVCRLPVPKLKSQLREVGNWIVKRTKVTILYDLPWWEACWALLTACLQVSDQLLQVYYCKCSHLNASASVCTLYSWENAACLSFCTCHHFNTFKWSTSHIFTTLFQKALPFNLF